MKIPDPQKQHRWLQQLVGSWEIDPAAAPEGQPETPSGTETVRKLGELWVLAEGAGAMPGGEPASSLMTLGYDPRTGRFVGSWIGSMMTHLWVYDGELDAAGRTLTLAADGPDMSDGDMSGAGKPLVPYRDAIELVSPDHRVLRSYSRGEDGGWQQFMELHYRRTGE